MTNPKAPPQALASASEALPDEVDKALALFAWQSHRDEQGPVEILRAHIAALEAEKAALAAERDALASERQRLRELLDRAGNGIEWRIIYHPTQCDKSDSEMLAKIRATLAQTGEKL